MSCGGNAERVEALEQVQCHRSSPEGACPEPGKNHPDHRQVFGLAGEAEESVDPTYRGFPALGGQCLDAAFVPAYRCGAVPDLHRIPSFNSYANKLYRQLLHYSKEARSESDDTERAEGRRRACSPVGQRWRV
jgi:hypothetical protein